MACGHALQVVQRSGEAWSPLRDDRPESINSQYSAHYLDGAYQSDCRQSLGCDTPYCVSFTGSDDDWGSEQDARWNNWPLIAREHIEVGDAPARICDGPDAGSKPDAGSDAGSQRVPLIESRTPIGALGVGIQYYLDSRCQTGALIAYVPVDR